jgi:hypothetical protein
MNISELLKKHKILPGETHLINIGCVQLSATRETEGWRLVTTDNCPDDDILLSEESTLADYFQTGKSNSLLIAPALPAKPLVFKGTGLNVLPGHSITLFLKIPLAFQIYFSKIHPENLLREISYKRLSNTWFGEPDAGEPAFALGSEYYLNIEEIIINGLEAICPVNIKNSSNSILMVQRLIIRTENITLYKNEDKIVTSLVQVEHRGAEETGSVEYRYSKIYNGEKQEILAGPRNTSGNSLLNINFHFIKNIYRSE